MAIREEVHPLAQAIYQTLSISSLHHYARETGFVQRQGKLKPEDFLILCSLSEDSVGDDSLQELCGAISHQSHTSISKQALHDRFNDKGVAFLRQIFLDLATKQNWFVYPLDVDRLFSRIRIMDATSFRLPNEHPDYPGAHFQGGTGPSSHLLQIKSWREYFLQGFFAFLYHAYEQGQVNRIFVLFAGVPLFVSKRETNLRKIILFLLFSAFYLAIAITSNSLSFFFHFLI